MPGPKASSHNDMNGLKIIDLSDPDSAQDAATKAYTDVGDAARQPLDSDLTAIAAIAPANDDLIQRKAGAWTNRTIAQIKADLSITAADDAETNARIAADNAEASTRAAADTALAASLTTEATTRAAADTALSTNLATEVIDRAAAVTSSSAADRARANHTGTQLAATVSDFNTAVRTSRLDQMAVPTSSVSMNNQRVVSGADPVNGTDLATKQYVDTFSSGVDFHQEVRVCAEGNVNISTPPAAFDGVTMSLNERVLLKDQTDPIQNGIFVYGTPMVRSQDANSVGELIVGSTAFVRLGTANGGEQWVVSVTSTNPWVPDSSSSTWVQNSATPSLGTTVVSETSFGQSATPGSAGTTSRSDHTHGSPPLDSDLVTIAAIAPTNDDIIQRKSGAWTNRTIAQYKTDLNLVADTSAALTANSTAITTESNARTTADTTLTNNLATETSNRIAADNTLTSADTTEAATRSTQDNLRVLKAGDVMTGNLLAPSYINSNLEVEKCWSVSWANTVANQKADLYFTAVNPTVNGLLDVFISCSLGVVTKRFAISLSGSSSTQNTARYTDVMGTTPNYFAISDLTYDATNSRWRIKLVQRGTMAAILTSIFITMIQAPGNADTLLPTFGISSVYTTDATAYALPVVSYEGALIVQSIQTSFRTVPASQSYTVSLVDSVILAGSGASIVLPSAVTVGGGRSYMVKNIGTSGVAVTATAGTIDAGSSYTIGNRSFGTFMSDGTNWWVVS